MILIPLLTPFFVIISSKYVKGVIIYLLDLGVTCENPVHIHPEDFWKYDANFPRFRILAPQLICPKDEHSPIVKPNITVITIQTDAPDLYMNWTVRWFPLDAPSQRFTILLWRTVRALEAKLNKPQPESYVYVIDDDELLFGVNYIFNVTASVNGESGEPKSFYINNTFGESKLEAVDGLADKMSVLLLGSQVTFADIEYVLEADVTTCVSFYDYHFSWKVESFASKEPLNISSSGSRLEIPPYSLQAGMSYDITGYIIEDNTGKVITQVNLPLEVSLRGLEVYLGADELIVGTDQGFTLESIVINHDHSDMVITFQWRCIFNEMVCESFEDINQSSIEMPYGFSIPGQYEIILIASLLKQSAEAKVTITVLSSILPIIQVQPIPRILNEGSTVTLVANGTNVSPMCTLRWYYATKDELTTFYNTSYDESPHGTPITDAVNVYSLEETFLYELVDFSNDTQWREVIAEVTASTGRARFLVECNCSLALGCATQGYVYADVYFKMNKGPSVGVIAISPTSGTALETIFRVSTRPAADLDGPLRYSFLCSVGDNVTVLLASYLEHLAVETLLPYLASGTDVWVQVCDVRGACSDSERKIVHLLKGEGRSIHALKAATSSHIKRCEMMALQRTAITAIATYTNAGQTEALTIFTTFLLDSLPTLSRRCVSRYHKQYLQFLNDLHWFGLDTTGLI